MTKAPFSVEWLSQSSQALKSPTEGFPHPAPSAAPGPPGPSLSEGGEKRPAVPRAGTGGRSRDRLAAAPAAGEQARGAEQPPEGGPGGRRLRRAFSAEQLSALESSFRRQRYLGAAERRRLAGRMGLPEAQIKTWFQNRRMKLKRQLQELRTEPFCAPPLPCGPQGGLLPLSLAFAARPPPLAREGSAAGGCTLAAGPAPTLGLGSACRAQPGGFWVAPRFVGCSDPTAFLLGV